MVKQDNLAGCLVLRDQVTGTSPSARVSYGLALYLFGGVQQLPSSRSSWGHRGETVTVKAKKRKELRSFRLVAIAAAALGAGFLAWVGLGLGAEATTTLVSNLFQAMAALAAAGACFNAARRNPYGFGRAWTASLHRAWRLLGSAALAWGLGQVVWTYLRAPGRGAERAVAGRRRLPDRGAAAGRRGAGLPHRPHAGHGPAAHPAGRPADRRLPAVPRLGHRARRRLRLQRRRPLDPGAGRPARLPAGRHRGRHHRAGAAHPLPRPGSRAPVDDRGRGVLAARRRPRLRLQELDRQLRHRGHGRRRVGRRLAAAGGHRPQAHRGRAAPQRRRGRSRRSPGSPSPTRRWSWPPSPP